jgi:cellulose biosynthesis protein BcsQ
MRTCHSFLKSRIALKSKLRMPFNLGNFDTVEDAIKGYKDEDLYIVDCPSPISERVTKLDPKMDAIILPTPTGKKDLEATVKILHSLAVKGYNLSKYIIVITRTSTAKQTALREYQDSFIYLDKLRKINPEKFNFKISSIYFREMTAVRQALNGGETIFETPHPLLNKENKYNTHKLIKEIGEL